MKTEIPSVEIAKAYAEKKGYKYAHLWYNLALAFGSFSSKGLKWQTLMDRYENQCREAKCRGSIILGEYAPVKWWIEG